MANVAEVETKINEVLAVATRTFKGESEPGYQQLQTQVYDLEGLAREAFQTKLEDVYWPIVSKLEEGQTLTTAELDMLELLMVGEAKYYIDTENDLDSWRAELKRLMAEIQKLQATGLDEIDRLMRLRALCREAMRVLPDMAYYFREQERVRRFETMASGPMDKETRRSLANLIKEMIQSDQV